MGNDDGGFQVIWGFTQKRFDREHPNLDWKLNSVAVIESAAVDIDATNLERKAVLLKVSHPDYKEGVYGNILADSVDRARSLAKFVAERKGEKVEQVEREFRASDLFGPKRN
jgi:hypothetical protein